MKETGIIMSGNHPKLILDGIKTKTRRTYGLEFVNQDPDAFEFLRMEGDLAVFHKLRNAKWVDVLPPLHSFPKKSEGVDPNVLFYLKCPYGQVGGRLWVRETWAIGAYTPFEVADIIYKAGDLKDHITVNWEVMKSWLPADYNGGWLNDKWYPSIFMPRWASRITLEITGVRVERLQEISNQDVLSEGVSIFPFGDTLRYKTGSSYNTIGIQNFQELWNSLNAKRGYGWEVNPWVWVVTFKLIKGEGNENLNIHT